MKGDGSPHISRLMYYNWLGLHAYRAGAHDVRIVCNNTLQAATAQAEANNTLRRFRHTQGAEAHLTKYLEDMTQVFLGLKKHQDLMMELTKVPVTREYLEAFLVNWIPMPKADNGEVSPNVKGRVEKVRSAITTLFEKGDEAMEGDARRSRYALLQAATFFIDHPSKVRGDQDQGSMIWDGLVGGRAGRKAQALDLLAAPTIYGGILV